MRHKALRLKKNTEFKTVLSKGAYCADNRLVLYALPNARGENYFGVSVGKKLGKSVKRNRVKRLIREAVRAQAALLRPGHDIVILARPGAAGEPFVKIERSLTKLLHRSGLYKTDE